MKTETWKFDSGIRPGHLIMGFGSAERELLATSLALLDDSKLIARLAKYLDKSKNVYQRLRGQEIKDHHERLNSSVNYWLDNSYTDDQLRIILWIKMRAALALPPKVSFSTRGTTHLASDIVAALVNALDPPGARKSARTWLRTKGWLSDGEQAATLEDIVVPLLDDFLEQAVDSAKGKPTDEQRHQILEAILKNFTDPVGKTSRLKLKELKVDSINDAAVLKVVLTGAALGGIGASVSIAGFSAYIFAAKASAVIPMVSGPGLVSLLHVLANPITFIAGTTAVGWWAFSSAKRRANALVAARIIAVLTIRGLQKDHGDSRQLRDALLLLPSLHGAKELKSPEVEAYCTEWARCQSAISDAATQPDGYVVEAMERPLPTTLRKKISAGSARSSARLEFENAAALGLMTIGDVIYSAASIDPTIIAAADFSRIADVDSTIAFSKLAEDLLEGSSWVVQGGINQLKGYVAEKVIAGQLAAAGHTVSFPSASNSPGWDIMVDGQPFQVKFHQTLSGIRRHFDRYDYPVYANTELIDSIPEDLADKVFFVDGVSNEMVTHLTEHSLDAADGMLDTNVPAFAFLISTTRGVMGYHSGKMSGQQAIEQVLLDGTARIGLATGGSFVGAGLGFMLFGPAGAWVFTPAVAILAQSQASRLVGPFRKLWLTRKQLEWINNTHEALDRLQDKSLLALRAKRQQLNEKIAAVPSNEVGSYVRWRLQDLDQHAAETEQDLARASRTNHEDPKNRLSEMLRVISLATIHPAAFQPELREIETKLIDYPTYWGSLDTPSLRIGWEALVERGRKFQEDRNKSNKVQRDATYCPLSPSASDSFAGWR